MNRACKHICELLPVFLFVVVVSKGTGAPDRPSIGAADVVFMYSPRNPEQYDQYAGTVVGWGGRTRARDARSVESWRRRVDEAHKRDMRYCGSVDFLVDFRGFIDFRPDTFMDATCRDLDDKPIRVPWLMDHEYKGNPAWWWCTNNPDYRAYLRDQAGRACLAPIDGLHIDDWAGTSHCSSYRGGCFCPHCMKGFREYLAERFSKEELARMGVGDSAKFDYRGFLKARGVTTESFLRKRREVPLVDVFQDFQNSMTATRMKEIFEYAEQLRGRPLVRSVNSGLGSPREVLPAPLVDYFCGEVGHNASAAKPVVNPVFVFKLVEALGRRQTATASGHDWAWIKANEKPGLVRTWIAQTYAHGSVFMVPHRQWCYTPELGTHWWSGKPEDFAWVYRFVREQRRLLEGYASLAQLKILYTQRDFQAVRSAATKLSEANVPFEILLADDIGVEAPRADALAGKEALLVKMKKDSALQLPESLKSREQSIGIWEGVSALPEAVRKSVKVDGPNKVRVTLRHKPGDPDAPIICHVLNQNYDLARDDVQPVNARITIANNLLESAAGGVILSVFAHSPKGESRQIVAKQENGGISFELENLGLWTIVELKTAMESGRIQ